MCCKRWNADKAVTGKPQKKEKKLSVANAKNNGYNAISMQLKFEESIKHLKLVPFSWTITQVGFVD